MEAYQHDFIKLCVESKVIQFGEFTLKSGRKSPYFFNAGLFNTGTQLSLLGDCYASVLAQSGLEYDLLFGPAYKGIPLVSAAAISLAKHFNLNKPYSFNRKEVKGHGEGGQVVGAPIQGRVLIVDDVITAGTAIKESLQLISLHQAQVAGVVVLLDRQERGQNQRSAIEEVKEAIHAPVLSVIKLDDIIEYVAKDKSIQAYLPAIKEYRAEYGI